MSKEKNLTAKEFAEAHEVGHSTVRLWCRTGRIKGAFQEETPFGVVWYIPESTSKNFQKPQRGRPSKAKE